MKAIFSLLCLAMVLCVVIGCADAPTETASGETGDTATAEETTTVENTAEETTAEVTTTAEETTAEETTTVETTAEETTAEVTTTAEETTAEVTTTAEETTAEETTAEETTAEETTAEETTAEETTAEETTPEETTAEETTPEETTAEETTAEETTAEETTPEETTAEETTAEETTAEETTAEETTAEETTAEETTAEETTAEETTAEETTAEETTAEETEPVEDIEETARSIIDDAVKSAIKKIDSDRYSGSTVTYPFETRGMLQKLTERQKHFYSELYDAITLFEECRFEPGYGGTFSDFITAANALYSDHPCLAFYSKTAEVKQISRVVAIEVQYFLPDAPNIRAEEMTDEIRRQLAVMDAVCEYITDSMPKEYSTFDKYRYLAAVISYRTAYDEKYRSGTASENAYGALVIGDAICRGYSKAFEYLCEKAGLYCSFVQGSNMAMEVHMWNLVKLESGTYHVDVTWSDTTYGDTLEYGWMRYFMLTQKEVLSNHIIDNGVVATGTPIK